MTTDGVMRHPSFEGMRIDKKASEVIREKEKPVSKAVKETNQEVKHSLLHDSKKEVKHSLRHGSKKEVKSNLVQVSKTEKKIIN